MTERIRPERITGVDVFRFAAIIAVIIIHTQPLQESYINVGISFNVGGLLNQISRFAVPFFFTISGYFWASKFSNGMPSVDASMKMGRRIVVLFFAWSAIYLLPTNLVDALKEGPTGIIGAIHSNLNSAIEHPLTKLLQGTRVHLWFLMSLLICLTISTIMLTAKMKRSLIALSIALYIIGLLGKAYSDTPIGFHSNFDFRNGPFFGLIFFVSGYMLSSMKRKPSWLITGFILATAGFILHFVEILALKHFWGTPMIQDYVAGTYFLGVGTTLVALANPAIIQTERLSFIAPLTLGVYAIHMVFVDLLSPLKKSAAGNILLDIGISVSVLTLSNAASYALSRNRITKILVT